MTTQTQDVVQPGWLAQHGRPVLISGPCSAETEEQVLQTATRLFRTGKVDIIRAGIWKPRTRPNSFEGVGTKGLPWLQKVKEVTGLPVTIEVAMGKHVELALEFGIDILWIGARTTVNPFAVQEIADALRGVDIPVLVKNPLNPDLSLWMGGLERLEKVGITKLGAIHRGFSNFGEKIYRNRPQWQLPIELKRRMPELPIICDPSHICGRRDLLAKVSQKAMDLNFDGLMIESHITPDEAWSDAKQQITPEVYGDMIKELVIREDNVGDIPNKSKLDYLRKEINFIDDELINILTSRMKIARDIGEFKKENNITILQNDRWNEIRDKYVKRGVEHGLSERFILKFITDVHEESISQQEQIMQNDHYNIKS
jgi:chorismate mutase